MTQPGAWQARVERWARRGAACRQPPGATKEGAVLVGYVSDERYVALHDVAVEFEDARDGRCVAVVRSTPRGAVYADVEPGDYRVTLAKDGFGPKSVGVRVAGGEPYQFRLLSDRLL